MNALLNKSQEERSIVSLLDGNRLVLSFVFHRYVGNVLYSLLEGGVLLVILALDFELARFLDFMDHVSPIEFGRVLNELLHVSESTWLGRMTTVVRGLFKEPGHVLHEIVVGSAL